MRIRTVMSLAFAAFVFSLVLVAKAHCQAVGGHPGSTTVSGPGTVNTVPKFTGANKLGNSSISDNGTTVSTTEPIVANPSANGVDVITSTRFTDTLPTGNFINFKNAASTSIFSVSITGFLTTASSAAINGGLSVNGGNSSVTAGNFVSTGALNGITFSSTGSSQNAGIFPTAPGVFAIGNGTPGDVSGTLKASALQIGTTITSYNGVTTVANGVPTIVAKADATAQQANIAQTALYTVPVGGAGTYRISGYAVVTQAATTSSTVPNSQVLWTDSDTNIFTSAYFTLAPTTNTVGSTNTANFTGGSGSTANTIYAKAGTTIYYAMVNYASSGATPMQYAVHIKLEYLGN